MKSFTFTFLLCFIGFSLGAQSKKSTINLRTAASEVVVEGKVIDCQSFWNKEHTQILTSNLINVSKIFKGNLTGGTFEIITLGGKLDDRFSIVSDQTTFKKGMEGIFFCKSAQKMTCLNKSANVPFILALNKNGYIQYYYEKFNPAAADKSNVYKNVKKEIWDEIVLSAREPLRKLRPNTIEAGVEKLLNVTPENSPDFSPGIGISFTFENVSLTDNLQHIAFDVYAHISENGYRFGKAKIFINYNSDALGQYVVAGNNVVVSKGSVIQNSAYSLSTYDETKEEMIVDVTSNFSTLGASPYVLTTIPEQFCHVEFDIEDFLSLLDIGFNDFQMSSDCWYYTPSNSKYTLFDRVEVENPITKTNVEDPALIYYDLDSIRVTNSGINKFLEFNILASSNVNWTRLSIADIFLAYNTTAFGNSPDVSFLLPSELDNLGYNSSVEPYESPANLVELMVTQPSLEEEDSLKHILLGIDPKIIGRMKMKIVDCSEMAEIRFVDTLMSGLQFYFGGVPLPLIAYDQDEEINSDVYNQFLCISNAPIITKISPTVLRAGVSDTLIIEGKGFKPFEDYGTVFFRDAGFPDSSIYNPAYFVDVIDYTDTIIKIYVPSDLNMSDNGAGSGNIQVMNSLNKVATSDEPINIIYSITNVREPDTAYRIHFINQNGLGGYTFEPDGELEILGGVTCFESAVERWRCLTGVNWSVSSVANFENQTAIDDTVNMVFVGNSMLPDSNDANFLARTYLAGFRGVCNDGTKDVYYVDNMDIEINPYYNFAYDCSDIDTLGGAITEFYNVMLHELGHCHMLAHTVDPNDIIYPYNEHPAIDDPSPNNIAGARNVISFSRGWVSSGACSAIMRHDTVSCGTNPVTELNKKATQVSIYPNPFLDLLNIDLNDLSLDNVEISIYGTGGQIVYQSFMNTFSKRNVVLSFSSSTIPSGFYILRITADNFLHNSIVVKI